MTPSASISSMAPESQQPIRAELFSAERLEQHAESLAAGQGVTEKPQKGHVLTPRVLENGRILLECYRTLAQAVQQERTITPAAEWLVDNFFIVDEQIRDIRDHLPAGYYRKLPKLASGHLEGYPRVFGVAWAFVAHTDSRFDVELLRRFVNAYQRVQPLAIGELWALPITLRIVLVENLRRLAQTIVSSRSARQEADALADRLIGAGGQAAVKAEEALSEIEKEPLAEAFAVQLLERLRDLSSNVRPVLLWLDHRLAEKGLTADEVVRAEHQQQAALNVTVRNIITSMRMISSLDWHDFFESVSPVDEILAANSNFSQLTFATRDSYRHAIEDLARHSGHTETEVARMAAERAESARHEEKNGSVPNDAAADPGYYLISRGRLQFEREIGFQPGFARHALRLYARHGLFSYLGTIVLITAAALAFPIFHGSSGVSPWWMALVAVLALIPASDLAIALVNRFVTDLLTPRALPRLDLKDGVPEQLRTIVVIPTLLTKVSDVEELVGRLEVHYLANAEGHVHYALLSDWADAAEETATEDDSLLLAATEGIARLNRLHGPAPGGGLRFLLLHRRRVWNASERRWIGWERKRGKLHELNRFLRGSTETTFLRLDSRVFQPLTGVRYVLTVDSDTRMPRGSAHQLIGTLAHPLNRAVFSPEARRVVQGYGVAQPRITPSLPTERQGTIFQRIFSGPSGIDPYPAAISDVYQDLFHEGSYTGKGLYEIDAFENALSDKVPENILLSHDLFEGTLARTALVTDVEFFEEYPAYYAVAAARQDRWARGDWQLLPWIFGHGPKSYRTSIPGVGRWKMWDNLRRSLSAPSVFLALLACWLIPSLGGVWTRFILATIAIPAFLPFFMGLNPRRGISKRSYLHGLVSDMATGAAQTALTITFLSYQAWLMADAILRTLCRFLTRKHLLEWITAAQAKRMVDLRALSVYLRMRGGVILALAAGVALLLDRQSARAWGFPFVGLWLAAPLIARWVSLPPALPKAERVSASERKELRLIARRTWRFFETMVSAEDHYLPPDNFQVDPKPRVAHRTSPTNMGLSLLATLAAHDFGWIGISETVDRVEKTLRTMDGLERFHGHFFNWYDTQRLEPLVPKYVSSVDSGNLAGHLLAVTNGLRGLEHCAVGGNLVDGLDDNIELLREALDNLSDERPTHIVTRKQVLAEIEEFSSINRKAPREIGERAQWFLELRWRARTLADVVHTFARERGDPSDSELQRCADAVLNCAESHFRDAEVLIPGLAAAVNALPSVPSDTNLRIRGSAEQDRSTPAPPEGARLFDEALAAAPGAAPTASSPARLVSSKAQSVETEMQRGQDAVIVDHRLAEVIQTAERMFHEMDFKFLFDRSRKLFSIGYRATEGVLDASCYDLLASEARLTSFVAIAKGDAEPSHWFRLGRSFTPVDRASALISWSGSMFEYLMPALVMRSPAGSVLHLTNDLVVRRQIGYGAERHVPWGVSESAFNARDLDMTYQYSGFGIPGLGLKRGLSEDLVIAPYATALAAMVDPSAAARNLRAIAEVGGQGTYGFYEALDYTKTRVPEGQSVAVVHTYMVHHQGMSLISLANVVHDDVMQDRFHAEPIIQATELLLQERTPRDVLVAHPRAEEVKATAHVRELVPPVERRFTTAHGPVPRTQLLSNGKYAVMVTAAGSGYSLWGDIAITRWHEDATRDASGFYIYLRDAESGDSWSAGYQPRLIDADRYQAAFYEDRVEISRRDGSLATKLEVVVSSEDDAEIRCLSITNLGARERQIQVTSYGELCLTTQAAYLAHPAFSNLFVETEFHAQLGAIVATRRRQSADQNPIWLSHTASVQGKESGELEYDTDRSKFIGRGRTPRAPVSVTGPSRLSKTVGPVLDPIISLRRTVRVAPGKTARVVFATAVAPSRDQVLALADKYRDPKIVERILTMAWTQAQVQLRHLNIDPVEANLFQRLANFVLYPDSSLRPAPDILSRSPSIEARQLWGYGISGDLPIVVVFVDQTDDIGIIRQMLRAHEYWRIKQLAVDLVVINDEASSYDQELHGSLAELVRTSQLRHSASASPRGDVFLLRTDLIPSNVRIMLESMAHAVLVGRRGPLADQVTRAVQRALKPRAKSSSREPSPPRESAPSNWKRDLEFFNGLGGFSQDGREYVVHLSDNLRTPQPWVNVIANASFGFITSESGSGYTWSLNSRERQLTPWSNDPVGDPAGEVIYIRDEAEGVFWTPTALPIHEAAASYVARHGQGYTRFENDSHGIRSELLQFVPLNDTIKISRLTLENNSNYVRRLSITAYLEWVLGNLRTTTARYVVTELDSETHALFARSLQAGEFGGRVAFADLAGRQTSFTGDRREFLGRNGLTECPVAIERGDALSGKVGAGLDPCAALQTSVEIRPGARAEIVVLIGDAASAEDAQAMLKKYRATDLDDVLAEVISLWDNVLNGVQVRTPDRAMDLLLNRWLLYQTLSCRVWGRAAFYQVSGAYGFRDQLQDVMALCVSKRDVAREHLLRAAGRQFAEGDVQHWWHPPSGRGVRTKISDDPLWLPYAVSHWIERTGDTAIFDELVPFLEGDPIPEGHADSYFEPRVSEARATVFEHCARAIDSRLAVGTHGLPLMGTGDWNDGMNRVGEHGKGESVWLGWFLHAVLSRFAPIATERGEHERAQKWRLHMSALKAALEREAWDGEWYLRAFYDDGWPLGSQANNECRIDSIAQSWGVISRAAETGRAQTSMESVYTNLVDPTDGLVLLLTPPFGRVPPGGSESTNLDTLEPERALRAESPSSASVEAAERVHVAATGAGTRAQSGSPAPGPISTSIDARSDAQQTDRTNGNSSSTSEMRQTTGASGPVDRVETSKDHDPGYIKGYVPGIRENGGQYTHAAVWNILGFVMLGDGDRALELLRMLNPITHASSRVGVQRYKVEPYVIAGDVYSEAPHVGRGGWTWYTGSAGWLYRVSVETILGFQLRGMSLRIDPCISRRWLGFEITFRYHSAIYDIRVENPSSVSRGVALTRIDGVVHAGIADIPLANDAKHHEILVVLG